MTFLARKSDDLHHFHYPVACPRYGQNFGTTGAGTQLNYRMLIESFVRAVWNKSHARTHSADHPVRVAREHDKTEHQNHVQYQRDYQGGEHIFSPLGRAWHFGFAPATQALVEFVAWVGVASCVEHRRFRVSEPAKANERLAAATNNRSARSIRFFHQSPECFGRIRQRQTLRPRPIVRCVLPRCISRATAIGPATRLQPSFPKFSSAIRCATYE